MKAEAGVCKLDFGARKRERQEKIEKEGEKPLSGAHTCGLPPKLRMARVHLLLYHVQQSGRLG